MNIYRVQYFLSQYSDTDTGILYNVIKLQMHIAQYYYYYYHYYSY